MITQSHWDAIHRIVELLAEKRYEDVSVMCKDSRLGAEEMKVAVAIYGRRLVPLPEDAAPMIESIPVQKSLVPAWSVTVPLFTAEEGRSDLTLELTMTESPTGSVAAQIDDLHVL